MKKATCGICVGVLLISTAAFSEPASLSEPLELDPPQYFAFLRQEIVTIGRSHYYKFAAGRSAILVPKFIGLTRDEVERSLCVDDVLAACGMDPKLCNTFGIDKVVMLEASHDLDAETKVYAAWIFDTIESKCDGIGTRPDPIEVWNYFDIGVEWRSSDPRHPGSKRIYFRPSFELGGHTSF